MAEGRDVVRLDDDKRSGASSASPGASPPPPGSFDPVSSEAHARQLLGGPASGGGTPGRLGSIRARPDLTLGSAAKAKFKPKVPARRKVRQPKAEPAAEGEGGGREGDFEGGRFVTAEADGSLTAHRFERGDAIFFVSHKYHSVQPVTRGRRAVLVAALWHGPERRGAHRCEQRPGECGYSTSEANAERLLKGETPDLY